MLQCVGEFCRGKTSASAKNYMKNFFYTVRASQKQFMKLYTEMDSSEGRREMMLWQTGINHSVYILPMLLRPSPFTKVMARALEKSAAVFITGQCVQNSNHFSSHTYTKTMDWSKFSISVTGLLIDSATTLSKLMKK